MKGICIAISVAILLVSLAFAAEANEAAVTPNFEYVSDPLNVSDQPLPEAVPGKATLVAPTGTISTANPTFKWNAVSGSTWYYLWINGPSGNVFNKWYTAGEAACGSSFAVAPSPSLTLYPGTYTWWIQTWNADGYGPWSNPMSFTVSTDSGFTERFDSENPIWKPVVGNWIVSNGLLESHPDAYCGSHWNSIYYDADYTNFEYGATIWRGEPEPLTPYVYYSDGLVVRGNPSPTDSLNRWNAGYYFGIINDVYSVWKETSTGEVNIVPWTNSPYLKPLPSWNRLKVVCDGSNLAFYINQNLVWSSTDTSFTAGKVGLVHWSSDDGADFKVDEVQLRTLPGGILLPTESISPTQQKLNEEAWQKHGTAVQGLSSASILPIQEGCPNC